MEQNSLFSLDEHIRLTDRSRGDLLLRIGQWAHGTFPQWTDDGILIHVEREIAELRDDPSDGAEMADIIILLCHLAYEHDVDLMAAIEAKHVINQGRRWMAPDAQGVIEHERDD